jgi:hypothetical protein
MGKATSAACCLLLGLASVGHADKWAPPTPRVYASPGGAYGFKTVPGEKLAGPATGTLFTLDREGKEKVVWEAKLVNEPHRAFVSDSGKRVATVDTYAALGFKHAVVLYDDRGKPLADLALEDLFTADEIVKHAPATASSRHWAGEADFKFDENAGQFVAAMKWGKVIRISLETGKVSDGK